MFNVDQNIYAAFVGGAGGYANDWVIDPGPLSDAHKKSPPACAGGPVGDAENVDQARRRVSARPASARPNSAMLVGSGTAAAAVPLTVKLALFRTNDC